MRSAECGVCMGGRLLLDAPPNTPHSAFRTPHWGGAVIDLGGKRAFVTGGGRGIGRATAVLLAKAGASVVIGYRRRRAEAEETVKALVQAGGRGVSVSGGLGGPRGGERGGDYAATKGALIAFTKSLAVELAPRITVNCVAPGWVDTEMAEQPYSREGGEGKGQIAKTIPLGRVASPEDIAGPIVFLCSDLARHITGEILNVNGGSVLCG